MTNGPCCSESVVWKYIMAGALNGTNYSLPGWDMKE